MLMNNALWPEAFAYCYCYTHHVQFSVFKALSVHTKMLSPSHLLSPFLLSARYMLDKTRPQEATNNMKRLLLHCNNLPLKHKLAQQLGMQETLGLPTVDDGFLKDIARL